MSLPFIDLKTQYAQIKEDVDRRIHQVLDHGQYILGPEVAECESALAEYTQAPFALSCSNGTDALILCLMALEIGPGDEVIIPGFSFIATAGAVALTGARPVFVDIDPETFNIDIDKIEKAITKNTKALMPVSLFGQTPDFQTLGEVAEKHGLPIIEDAAQSFGAEWNGQKSCNLSTLAATSFFPAKPLGCYGDGGAVFTQNEELRDKLWSLRVHGQGKEHRYLHPRMGINGRMDTLQCAVILSKLQIFPDEVRKRQEVAERYREGLSGLEEHVKPPKVLPGHQSVFAQYTLRVQNRTRLQSHLKENNIPAVVYYPCPMHRQEAYAKYKTEELPNCDQASEEVLSLPMHPYLSADDQSRVTQLIRDFYTS